MGRRARRLYFVIQHNLSRLRQGLLAIVTPPPGLEASVDWFASAMRAVVPIGTVIHALLIFIFYALHVPLLAWLNVVSVAVWCAAWLLLRSRYLYVGTTLAMIEVLVHAAACVSVIGWESGFQYYLLGALASFFLFPGKRWAAASVIAAVLIEFGLLFLLRGHQPVAVIAAPLLQAMNIINIASAFGLSMVAALYYVHVAQRAEKALQIEHAKSEALLDNVMPAAIASRLKRDETNIADRFAEASVLFADIVGFTTLSQTLTPDEVVRMLDRIFSQFDELVERHGVEKIKTIGDAYMVAAGIPTPRHDHAEALASLALAMQEVVASFDDRLQLRMGIHSGPVVAGVIGRRRFHYDLWGDTVNTASRMESHGVPGEIQVSAATFARLDGTYSFEERGVVEIKGKGPMRTYFLRGGPLLLLVFLGFLGFLALVGSFGHVPSLCRISLT